MATINERFMDFQVAQQIRWIRLGNREAREALRILSRVDGQLETLLRRAGIGNTRYTQARLQALKEQIANVVNAIHSQELAPTIIKGATEAAQLAAEVEAGAFKRILPAGLDVTTPNLGVLQSAVDLRPFNGAVLGDWVDQLRAADLDRTWKTVLDGIISGTTTDDLIRAVNGSPALRYKDGVRQVTRRGTQALVRTSINHATNQGRQMVWEDNGDLISSVRWVATLDTRTTPICRHRDGRVGPVSADSLWKPPAGASVLEPPMARPPAHPNCRSTTVAVTKSWKELGFDVEELPAGTRASMDGQVPADMTYYDWLRRQPVDIQKDVLGKKRWEMWHNDGVSPDRFVNDEGRLLTLDQLRTRMGKDLDTLSARAPALYDSEAAYRELGNPRIELSKDADRALQRYTGSGYDRLNKDLREGRVPENITELDDLAKTFEFPEDAVVYRGIKYGDDLVGNRNIAEGLKALDDVLIDEGFMSTTTVREFTEDFTRGDQSILFEINVPKGTKGLHRWKVGESSREAEIVLGRGSRLRVSEIVESDDPRKPHLIRADLAR